MSVAVVLLDWAQITSNGRLREISLMVNNVNNRSTRLTIRLYNSSLSGSPPPQKKEGKLYQTTKLIFKLCQQNVVDKSLYIHTKNYIVY